MRINRWIGAAAVAGAVGWIPLGAAAQSQDIVAHLQTEAPREGEARVQVKGTPQEDVLYFVVDEQGAAAAAEKSGPTEDVVIQLKEPVGDGELHVEALGIAPDGGAPASKYWIGVMCQPLDEPLRAHLNLTEGEGVIVGEVLPESPAEKSGLKKYDVILSAGDVKVMDAGALMKVVEQTGPKELQVHVIRAGHPNVLTVVPAERTQVAPPAVPAGQAGRDRMYRLIERFQTQPDGPVMRFFHPGVVAPPPQAMPENLDMRIEKHGNEPAKIHVEQDGKTWDVTENELGELPEDLRGHIGRMIGQGGGPIHALLRDGGPQEQFQIQVVPPPGAPQVAPLPPEAPEAAVRRRIRSFTERVEGEAGDRLERRLDQINERLDRLQELIDRLQKQDPKPDAPPSP